MEADAPKLLWDALQAAEKIGRFCDGHDFDGYRADEMLRSAVERQLEILGEALGQLRKVDPELAAGVPDLHRAVALRNVLIHAYANVDDAIVWGVVETQLPALRQHLRNLLP
jgi:uncharacterized protein with HEPN domain